MDSSMHQHTIAALFNDRSEASRAVDELIGAGIARGNIRVSPESDVTSVGNATAYDVRRDEKGFWASLADLFMPDDDRYNYAEAMHRGNIMVSVSVTETQRDVAEDILERHGTINLDEQVDSWRKTGWAGYTEPRDTAPSVQPKGNETQALPEVEERLRVGKRQVNAGRVKVRSYVVERPVSEQVNLHSETVRVERRPVDRPLTGTEDAFKERTIEATATAEEAVISKEARVTGEVLVRKEASDRTETVTDKLRSTKVAVEEDNTAGTTRTTPKPR